MNLEPLVNRARQVRKRALASIYKARSGHPGGVLSCADLVVYIFENIASGPDDATRDRFILSKGHAAPASYAAAAEHGWVEPKELAGLRKIGSPMQGHPHVGTTPWVETSTGSLGQGFSVSIGMAMGFRHQGIDSRVSVMLGDGEMQEGEVWEAAMCAAHYKLDNLCAVVDYNKMQSDDLNENIMGLESLRDKWAAFNWNVIEIDGHDFEQIDSAFKQAEDIKGKPTVIIAHTIKGKGVSFMEGVPAWHGSVALKTEELDQSLRDLGAGDSEVAAYLDGTIWG